LLLAKLAPARRPFVEVGLAVGSHRHHTGCAAEAPDGVGEDRVGGLLDRLRHGDFSSRVKERSENAPASVEQD
jgi:hypothetical protein